MTAIGGKSKKELNLNKQQLQEIVDDYDMYVEGIEFFLNIETGDVIMLRTFDMDEEYADMMDFAATIEDKSLHSTLMNILSGGKRIFRRFKDALSSEAIAAD